MASSSGRGKIVIISVIALAIMAPITIKFVTDTQTSTVNYAAEDSSPKVTLNQTAESLMLGSKVSFTTIIPKNIVDPKIEVLCYQENRYTFGTTGNPDQEFMLGGESSIWKSEYPNDPADCVVNLYHFEDMNGRQINKILTSTSFSVPGR